MMKRRRNSTNSKNGNPMEPPPTLESLPDDVLVKIGLSTAKLCGICDFLSLSRASKRLHGILEGSQETVDEIVRFRIATIRRPIGSRTSHTLATCQVQTLRQLDVCECLAHHELMEENRILIGHRHFMPAGEHILTLSRTVNAILDILSRHPSLRVALHVHDGLWTNIRNAPWKHADTVAKDIVARIVRRRTTIQTFQGNRELCFVIYDWGTRISQKSNFVSRFRGWIEVIFEIHNCNKKDGSGSGSTTSTTTTSSSCTSSSTNEPGQSETLELPPRSDIYNDNENQEIRPTRIQKYMIGAFGVKEVS